MKVLSSNSVNGALVLLALGCNTIHFGKRDSRASESQTQNQSIDFLDNEGGFFAFCSYRSGEIANETALPADRQFCSSELLAAACDQQESTVVATAASLLSGDDIREFKKDSENEPFLKGELVEWLKSSAKQCLDRGQILADLTALDVAAQPKNLQRVEAGRRRFWRYAFRATFDVAVRGVIAYRTQFGLQQRLRSMFRYAVCSGATTAGARLLEKNGGTPQETACMKSISSVCSALGGFIHLENVVSDQELEGFVSSVVSIADVGLEAACDAIKASVACGFISSALGQIRDAFVTGTNDWGECVGTAELGRKLGAKTVELRTGITDADLSAKIARAFTIGHTAVSPCCVCNRNYYQDFWVSDQRFRQDAVFLKTVERELGVADTFCKSYEKRPIVKLARKYEDHPAYYRYESCQAVTLRGAETCDTVTDQFTPGFKIPVRSNAGELTGDSKTFAGGGNILTGTLWCKDNRCN